MDDEREPMAPNSPLAVRFGIATVLLVALSALGFAIPQSPESPVTAIHGLAILAVPITALIATVAQSRWKVRYRESTGTWTRKEFLARLYRLHTEADLAGLVELYGARSVAGSARRRREVLQVLSSVGTGRLQDPGLALAIDAARQDRNGGVRAAACDALCRSRGEGATDVLIEALDDPDPDVRLAAARSLGTLRSRRAVPGLRAALGDSDAGVQAAFALAEIGDAGSLSAVEIAAAASRSGWHAKQLRKAAARFRD